MVTIWTMKRAFSVVRNEATLSSLLCSFEENVQDIYFSKFWENKY